MTVWARPRCSCLQQGSGTGKCGLLCLPTHLPVLSVPPTHAPTHTIPWQVQVQSKRSLHLCSFQYQHFVLLEACGLFLCSSSNLKSLFHLSHNCSFAFCNIPLLLALISYLFFSPEIRRGTKEWEWKPSFASPWMIHYLIFFHYILWMSFVRSMVTRYPICVKCSFDMLALSK